MSKFPLTERTCACGQTFMGRGRAKWCSDRCRKQTLYSVPCADCGAPLNGSDGRGPNAATRCVQCAAIVSGQNRTIWTREVVIDRIQEWARIYGDAPGALDWSPFEVAWRVRNGQAPPQAMIRAERFKDADGHWPWATHVHRIFGSWNSAIEAAGFTPRAAHGGADNWRRHGVYLEAAA